MSIRKQVRKRSNWYIYLLTFMIMFMVCSFVVYNIWDFLFPAKNLPAMARASADYRPDASFDTTFLLMMSENKGTIPVYYMLLNYRPRDEVITLVPVERNLYAEVGNIRGTLNAHYIQGGADGVMLALRNSLGVSTDHYIKFDKDSFISFFNAAGYTPVRIPYDLRGGEIEFLAGSYDLKGDDLYDYITYPDYNQGDYYRLMLHGLTISNFINKNSSNISITALQNLFSIILNTTDTSLEFSDFTKNQQAYLYTTQNSFDIADYYVPIGNTDENGVFVISETAIESIRGRFGMNRD